MHKKKKIENLPCCGLVPIIIIISYFKSYGLYRQQQQPSISAIDVDVFIWHVNFEYPSVEKIKIKNCISYIYLIY